MVMDKYYTQDHWHEVWKKINSLHLSYLAMEESPQKLDHRNKLEDCINNYLCNVPHTRKFEFQDTANVLYRSASSKTDFSGYKAALGWDAIGRYAANLITKPWRREYRQIKMYSGFYRHEIESNLVGAETMFEMMGYVQIADEVLLLDGPVCPDRVTSVSLDSLMAYVECQILKAIWEEVTAVFNISWLEVLKFRETHLCSPKQSVSSLIYLHHQRQYQDKMHNYPQMDLPPMCNNLKMLNMQQIPMYPTMPSHVPHMTYGPPPCIHSTNGCCGNYMPYNPHQQYASYMPTNYVPVPFKPPPYNPVQKYQPVPTAQLIDLDPHTYDTPDSSHNRRYDPTYDAVDRKMKTMYVTDSKKSSEPKLSDRDDGSGTFESWDYVYRNLESQGYCKDLGERGDILSQPLKSDENQRKANKGEPKDKRKSEPQSNFYDNVPDMPVKSKHAVSKPEKKTAVEVRKKLPETAAPPADLKTWHCSTCTYLNTKDKDICEMCGKSRNPPQTSSMAEVEVGGAECVKCTLVNSKDKKICVACGASLTNSPTYI